MTGFGVKIVFFSATFLIGMTLSVLIEQAVNRAASHELSQLSVKTVYPETRVETESPQFKMILDSLEAGQFFPASHACGNGFLTSYYGSERKRLSHDFRSFGSAEEAQAEFYELLGSADTQVDLTSFVVREGKRVTRFFVKDESDDGTVHYTIAWMECGAQGYTSVVGPEARTTQQLESYVSRPR